MLRIGITGDKFMHWAGGLDFLRTIVGSLYATSVPMEIHILAPGTGPLAALQRFDRQVKSTAKIFLGYKAEKFHTPSRADFLRAIASFDVPIELHDIDIGSEALYRQAKHLSIDVLLPSFSPLPFGRDLPWIGYLYDFQHRYLPEFFTDKERRQRDQAFQSMLSGAQAIIVNANTVKKDIEKFYPDSSAKVFALPFSAAPSPSWLSLDASSVKDGYGVPRRYFILCNQFWLHKDHATAFKAFADFAQDPTNSDIALVCTGATSDYRSMDYFNGLLEIIRINRLESQVLILGLLPKNDQIALMKDAIALLQPTLNEGGPGGGGVYDALSIGVPSIISNIPVNLEIAEEKLVSYFPVGDSKALSNAMKVAVVTSQSRQKVDELMRQGNIRRLRCGNTLIEAIKYVRD